MTLILSFLIYLPCTPQLHHLSWRYTSVNQRERDPSLWLLSSHLEQLILLCVSGTHSGNKQIQVMGISVSEVDAEVVLLCIRTAVFNILLSCIYLVWMWKGNVLLSDFS